MRAWVELGPSLDADEWGRRHAAGEVPDVVPYGLDRLVRYGVMPRVRPVVRGQVSRLAAKALRGVSGYQWLEASRAVPPTTDVVVAWDERAGVPRTLRRPGVPVATGVIWVGEPETRRSEWATARTALPRAALVWVLSRAQLPILRELGVMPRRAEHLVFGVDADFFRPAASSLAEPGLIVSVGNDRHRDWATLLKAFDETRRRVPGARLEVVTKHHLPPVPGVIVHERLDHRRLRELYARASVVAVTTSPNLHVSGMTAALEAKASGRPVVLSATAGADDYVDHATEGRLVQPGSVASVGAALAELLDGGTAAVAELGAAGRRTVEVVHSSERQAQRLAELLRSHC